MKRAFKILTAIVVLLGLGSYGLWHYVSNQMLAQVDTLLKGEQELALEDLTYDIETFGYPTMVGVTVSNIQGTLVDESAAGDVIFTVNGETSYYVSLVDSLIKPGTFHTQSRNLKVNIEFKADEGQTVESGIVRADIGNAKGSVTLGHNAEADVDIADFDLYAFFEGMETEERLATLDAISYKGKYTEDAFDMVHADAVMDIAGATFIDPTEKNSIKLEKLSLDFAYVNMPKALLNELRTTLHNASETGDAKPLKEKLTQFVEAMAVKNSEINLNNIHIKTEGLEVKALATLGVAEDFKPKLNASIRLEADNKINKILPEGAAEQLAMTPFGQQLTGGNAKLELSARVENGFLTVNKMPLFSVPSLITFVELMPNNIDVENEAYIDVPAGPQVAPEEPVDDLLGHFKKEEAQAQ